MKAEDEMLGFRLNISARPHPKTLTKEQRIMARWIAWRDFPEEICMWALVSRGHITVEAMAEARGDHGV